ncbi:MAG TPA: response regulator [Vicinamibacterales bacterium]|nr:response regulator [Vicinamibacterales bacterium]
MAREDPMIRRGTVLIVDDDPQVTHTFARLLSDAGYAVSTAADADSAIRTLETMKPDAMLLDFRLPEVDGLEFLRRLRTRPAHASTPVAVITGDFLLNETITTALHELGATLYFKPLWRSDLVAVVDRLLSPAPDPAAQRLRLLLVDDCAAERDLYAMVLQPDFTILTASRGDDGVNVATRTRPDAIILDVSMPGLTGWEACARLKTNPDTEHIPVILLTGVEERDLSQHAMAVGASALLRKPCAPDQLRDTVIAATRTDS